MAATMQHCTATAATTLPSTTTNPKLKRIVYSKYRELLGSYNDKANAIIETLPTYMVHEDRGFNFETKNDEFLNNATEIYGSANGRSQQNSNYEAPACVQNAMMTKDKKPFTYTPGGIDLSQIKSERMAKRLARNAQAEGTTGAAQQQNRPAQPQSPGGGTTAAAAMGAAAMGMPFQVLPPPPPPPQPGMAGKKPTSNGSTPAPPPPPSSNTFSNNPKTLAPPTNGGGLGSAPGSPNAARKSPTPQRFEPPPLGFRPEIKIPTNPMASLRKVPPPVEKNTFWKDEYVKDRSKSPMVGENDRSNSPAVAQNNNYNYSNNDNDEIALKKPTPTTTPSLQQQQQQQQQQYQTDSSNFNNNNYNNNDYNQQSTLQPKTQASQQQYNTPTPTPPPPPAPPTPQQQNSPRAEFRSVTAPQSPSVNVYTRQTESPRSVVDGAQSQQQRATESPFKFAQQQQHPHLQRPPAAMSPLAQPQQTQAPTAVGSIGQAQPQAVPWRTQRNMQPQQQQQQQYPQQTAQPIYNNVPQSQQQQQFQAQPVYNNVQQQRSTGSPGPAPYTAQMQQQSYDDVKPTSVGSLYIAPLAPPTEPQAQNLVRQQLQQQQQQRNSPMRQLGPQSAQQQQQLRWLSSQPAAKEQPEWARPEENGNVMPSSLQRLKSPPPPAMQQQHQQQLQQQQQQQQQQQPQQYYQPSPQQQQPIYASQPGNGYTSNFGSQPVATSSGLRLQIIPNNTSSNAPRERIIPIQLEQTPTDTPNQPNFGTPNYGPSNTNVAGYIVRSPNQFVDQGYNNLPSALAQQQQNRAPSVQRVMSPTQQMRIIPIAVEGGSNDGSRGPISQSPIVFQNDSRTPPIQSKSFRILQKITDTIDNGNSDEQISKNNPIIDTEPAQLQRPQYARQMSAQQVKNSPPTEQMRRMQIGQEQESAQQYIPPSEQQVPEPKKYTGSAIPSRSFKILQAMTTPENAEQTNLTNESENLENNELNETINYNNYNNNATNEPNQNKIMIINNDDHNNKNKESEKDMSQSKTAVTALTSNNTNNNSNTNTNANSNANANANTSTSSSTNPANSVASSADSHSLPQQIAHYPAYVYPYAPYPWYPPAALTAGMEPPPNWPYGYALPTSPAVPPPNAMPYANCNPMQPIAYPTYPFFFTQFYPQPSPHSNPSAITEYDSQNVLNSKFLPTVMPPYAYAYPVAPSFSQSSNSSRSSSVVPDIIITPSNDEKPATVALQHHIHVEKRAPPKRSDSLEIEEVACKTTNKAIANREKREGSVIDILSQRLNDITKLGESHGNLSKHMHKHYAGEEANKFGVISSPTENSSPVQICSMQQNSETNDDSSPETSTCSDEDTESLPKDVQRRNPLQAIKSVTNVQFYKGLAQQIDTDTDSDTEDDEDVTTADGKSDIFDEIEEFEDEEEESNSLDRGRNEGIEVFDEEYMEEDLSVIYEEESELERSSDFPKTEHKVSTVAPKEEKTKDSDLVSVRLPLKFSYSSKIGATVEIGKSHIEDHSNSAIKEEKVNSFSIAKLTTDLEDEEDDEIDDDCDVSVTISLTPSTRSRSSSEEKKIEIYTPSAAYPVEEIPEIPEEDVAVAFSLNLRNKFMNETMKGELTNNISQSHHEVTRKNMKCPSIHKEPKYSEELDQTIDRHAIKNQNPISTEDKLENDKPSTDFDFFATLKATKLQAQQMLETSKNYWGTPLKEDNKTKANVDKNTMEKCNKEAEDIETKPGVELKKRPLSIDESSLAKAKNDFWATVAGANTKSTPITESDQEDVDFWSMLADKSAIKEVNGDEWAIKAKSAVNMPVPKDEKRDEQWSTNMHQTKLEILPRSLITEIHINEVEKSESKKEEEEEKKKPTKKGEKKEKKVKKEKVTVNTDESTEKIEKKIKTKKNSKTTTKKSDQNLNDPETSDKPKKKKVGSLKKKKETTQKIEVNIQMQTENQVTQSTTEGTDNNIKNSYTEIIKFEEKVEENTKETLVFEQQNEEEIDFWAEIEQSRSPSQEITNSSTGEANMQCYSNTNNNVSEKLNSESHSHSTVASFWEENTEGNKKSLSSYQEENLKYGETNANGNYRQSCKKMEEIETEHLGTFNSDANNEECSFYAGVSAKHEEFYEEIEEVDFWAELQQDEEETKPDNKFDPSVYPEEPREVDTDEEIDFWAEIEAKRTDSNQDVTFHSAATFWAKRDRQNSVEETPYMPVERKAFAAKLPDEPSVDINIWAALEAAKGEEPTFIDPAMEEEKMLAQEFNTMTDNMDEEEEEEENDEDLSSESASLHEAVETCVWESKGITETNTQNNEEPDFWAEIESDRENMGSNDEAEIKRSNYRKAMAFFTTSIDEHKEPKLDNTNTDNKVHSKVDKFDNQQLIESDEEDEDDEEVDEDEDCRSESNSTPTNLETVPNRHNELPEVYVEETNLEKKYLPNGLPNLYVNKFKEEQKISVKERISAFESSAVETIELGKTPNNQQSLAVEINTIKGTLSRNSSSQLSEEDDSGVTDMNKQLSETDTESESFPELRKMSSYQRAATHSRLFKLLQDETDLSGIDQNVDEFQLKPSRRKIVHNVSITRKQNPQVLTDAETMTQRRERLSLPLCKNISIDADNPSTPNSPASPTMGQSSAQRGAISDKLVHELIQSLLLKSDSSHLRNLPMEKLQAAAKRALEEELDSLENTSVDSTPAMTPGINTERTDKSYADYYDTWSEANGTAGVVPSKAFRTLHDNPRRSPLTVRCPRVLSSKTINRDLARVTESPEIFSRGSNSPEFVRQSRERSVSTWRK